MQSFSDYFYLASGLLNFQLSCVGKISPAEGGFHHTVISPQRDFIKKAPFAFCEGGALFFIICQARAFRQDS